MVVVWLNLCFLQSAVDILVIVTGASCRFRKVVYEGILYIIVGYTITGAVTNRMRSLLEGWVGKHIVAVCPECMVDLLVRLMIRIPLTVVRSPRGLACSEVNTEVIPSRCHDRMGTDAPSAFCHTLTNPISFRECVTRTP